MQGLSPEAPRLSVVVPVYGCARTIAELHRRLTATLEAMGESYEIVLVDDRSRDDAWPVLDGLARSSPRTVALRLSRNFGQHRAIAAGLAEARGDYAVIMDCDLEDPPEMIPLLWAEAQKGAQIVYTRRQAVQQSALRQALNRLYFRILNALSGARIDPQIGAFNMISRRVIDAYLAFGETDRHHNFILFWLGFETATIGYDRAPRAAGRSSYSLRRVLAHALEGLLFQTTVFLDWVIYLGFAVSALGLAASLWFVINSFLHDVPIGWTSLVGVILVMNGIVIASIGVVGLYVGRVFAQTKGRPLFVVESRTGPAAPADRRG